MVKAAYIAAMSAPLAIVFVLTFMVIRSLL